LVWASDFGRVIRLAGSFRCRLGVPVAAPGQRHWDCTAGRRQHGNRWQFRNQGVPAGERRGPGSPGRTRLAIRRRAPLPQRRRGGALPRPRPARAASSLLPRRMALAGRDLSARPVPDAQNRGGREEGGCLCIGVRRWGRAETSEVYARAAGAFARRTRSVVRVRVRADSVVGAELPLRSRLRSGRSGAVRAAWDRIGPGSTRRHPRRTPPAIDAAEPPGARFACARRGGFRMLSMRGRGRAPPLRRCSRTWR